jgi:hypothetical protein
MIAKDIEKVLRGGLSTAAVQVSADFCRIREKLKRNKIGGFQPMGQSFRATHGDLESLA